MRGKQKECKTWDTMTFAERGEYMQQAEESVRQYGNKELLLLFCLMKETGIRFGDILELRTENLQGKELLVIERKYIDQFFALEYKFLYLLISFLIFHAYHEEHYNN